MAAQHTPGPWAFMGTGRGSFGKVKDLYISGQEAAGISLCFINTGDEALRSEAQANARLIAAAPVLLSLLKTLVGYDSYETEYDGRMYTICPSCSGQDGQHRNGCEFTAARAAIAKATGEQA